MKNKKTALSVKENIQKADYVQEMKSSYIDYALSVIISRAIPDVRDGLKPVHRRILHSMNELNLLHDKPYKKSARVVGDVLGKYHPHGDSAVYMAMVRMAQPFSLKNPLVDGHGNFGSIDGDGAAAMRYTESRLAPIANELLRDIDKDVVSFKSNFDDSLIEPEVLPARFPNLLVNGASGIAVGMSTNIPPHNIREAINAALAYIEDEDISYKKLLSILKGPDFPTGGIITNKEDLVSIYETGKGSISIRAKTEIEDIKGGKYNIVITEVPYTVSGNVDSLLESISDAVKDKKVDDIIDLTDESKNDIRIVLETKRGANPEKILNQLFKHTKLQDKMSIEFLALVPSDNLYANSNLKPERLSLKSILHHFIEFQKEIVTRKTNFTLSKALNRIEIVEGLIKAFDYIDVIIDTIRGSETDKEAKRCLMTGDITNIEFKLKTNAKKATSFNFTEKQADAILDMRLRRLSNLQINALLKEKDSLDSTIESCNDILTNEDTLKSIIVEDLKSIASTYNERRKTKIESMAIDESLLINEPVNEDLYILLDEDNYIKTFDVNTFSKLQEEDLSEYKKIFKSCTNDKLCVFTADAKLHQVKVQDIPKVKLKEKGIPLDTMISIDIYSDVQKILYIDVFSNFTDKSLVMITSQSFAKIISASEFESFRSNVRSTKVSEDDSLIYVTSIDMKNVDEYTIAFLSQDTFILKFLLSSIPVVKKDALGVKCLALNKDSFIVSCGVYKNQSAYFDIKTEEELNTKLELNKFKYQGRNTKGKKTLPGIKLKPSEVSFICVENEAKDTISESNVDDDKQLEILDI